MVTERTRLLTWVAATLLVFCGYALVSGSPQERPVSDEFTVEEHDADWLLYQYKDLDAYSRKGAIEDITVMQVGRTVEIYLRTKSGGEWVLTVSSMERATEITHLIIESN